MLVCESPHIELVGPFLFIDGRLAKGNAHGAKSMEKVLMEKPKTDKLVYTEYELGKTKDGKVISIITILGRVVGKEFGRTHGWKADEVFQVLSGQGLFMLHEEKKDESIAVERVAAKKNGMVESGGRGVVIYNTENEPLVVACASRGRREYEFFEKIKGPAFFLTKDGFVQNPNCLIKSNVQRNAHQGDAVSKMVREVFG
ncbi:MAG: hypothetical protein QXD51_02590 [Candidatus Anstonellales archaeon]